MSHLFATDQVSNHDLLYKKVERVVCLTPRFIVEFELFKANSQEALTSQIIS